MATPPRDLSADPGLAPLSPPGPAQPIAHLHVDALSALSDDARQIVERQTDQIARAQAGGFSDRSLDAMRGMLRRLISDLYTYELKRNDALAQVHFDPTTGFGSDVP